MIAVDVEKIVLVVDGQEILLTKREFDVAQYIVANPGRVLSNEQILSHVWGYKEDEIDIGVIREVMSRIRRKLKSVGQDNIIKNRRGLGYYIDKRDSTGSEIGDKNLKGGEK